MAPVQSRRPFVTTRERDPTAFAIPKKKKEGKRPDRAWPRLPVQPSTTRKKTTSNDRPASSFCARRADKRKELPPQRFHQDVLMEVDDEVVIIDEESDLTRPGSSERISVSVTSAEQEEGNGVPEAGGEGEAEPLALAPIERPTRTPSPGELSLFSTSIVAARLSPDPFPGRLPISLPPDLAAMVRNLAADLWLPA